MTTKHHVARRAVSGTGVWIRRAWIAVALIPVFFVLAFAFGYVLYDLMGYQPENDDAPFFVDLVCTVAILAVALVPCVGAAYLGRRAHSVGDRRGLIPLGLGALAGLGLTIISLVTLVAS
jgi:hypothetical protein